MALMTRERALFAKSVLRHNRHESQ